MKSESVQSKQFQKVPKDEYFPCCKHEQVHGEGQKRDTDQ
uniref:S-hydroxymethylglutathione dehydrogenase n=1 Tax=Rhizophora mucronata TaxID=61149 RepID=A0A2P2K9T4_RHIMU